MSTLRDLFQAEANGEPEAEAKADRLIADMRDFVDHGYECDGEKTSVTNAGMHSLSENLAGQIMTISYVWHLDGAQMRRLIPVPAPDIK